MVCLVEYGRMVFVQATSSFTIGCFENSPVEKGEHTVVTKISICLIPVLG